MNKLDLIKLLIDDDKVSNKNDDIYIEVGKTYIFITVTWYITGRVKSISDSAILLESGAWIADTGKLSEVLKKGDFYSDEHAEIEPFSHDFALMKGCLIGSHFLPEPPTKVK